MFNLKGTVYIFENIEAGRVKVGVTINNPAERLIDVNRMWLGVKGRCQICGNRRLLESSGRVPAHVLSMKHCLGSHQLPVEKDVTLAEAELLKYKLQLSELTGSRKTSVIRKINSLEKLINTYRHPTKLVGVWHIKATFRTEYAYYVEKLAHQKLIEFSDSNAPFGEVFTCTADDAIAVVNDVLVKLDCDTVRK